MPFKSKSQRRWMHAQKPDMAKKWEKETPKGKTLPEKLKSHHDYYMDTDAVDKAFMKSIDDGS